MSVASGVRAIFLEVIALGFCFLNELVGHSPLWIEWSELCLASCISESLPCRVDRYGSRASEHMSVLTLLTAPDYEPSFTVVKFEEVDLF